MSFGGDIQIIAVNTPAPHLQQVGSALHSPQAHCLVEVKEVLIGKGREEFLHTLYGEVASRAEPGSRHDETR